MEEKTKQTVGPGNERQWGKELLPGRNLIQCGAHRGHEQCLSCWRRQVASVWHGHIQIFPFPWNNDQFRTSFLCCWALW